MKVRYKICLLLIGLLMALLSLVLWLSRAPQEAMPNPNGYHDFSAAAKALQGERYAYGDLSPVEAVGAVQLNEAALDRYREGLKKVSRVPIDLSNAGARNAAHEGAKLKRLTHTLITEAKVAEAWGEVDRALEHYLDALRFTYALPKGGLPFDYANATSCKALVIRAIDELVPKLSLAQRQQVLDLLDELESEQEPLKAIALRHRHWHLEAGNIGIWEPFSAMIRHRTLYPEAIALESIEAAYQSRVDGLRETLVPSAGISIETEE